MNILKEITIKNLKLNKKRTIVTIIGIMLSVALICAVAGMVTSFKAFLTDRYITNNGNRHITIENVSVDDLKYFTNNQHVKSMYLTENLGYARVDTTNIYKPYVYVIGYNDSAFANTTINIEEGRLPNDSGEIVISTSLQSSSNIKLGDNITLDIGKRVCQDGSVLSQNAPYYLEDDEENTCHEYIANTAKYEFKVVGIMERQNYSMESYSAPGYTVITKVTSFKESVNVSLLFKNASYYNKFTNILINDDTLNKYNYTSNKDLLRLSGIALSNETMRMLYLVAGVVISIILFTSVFIIKNSFEISYQEKRKMYGMLSTTGATSKQIKKCVLYEGFILGIIGIPLGILCGIIADFILAIIMNSLGSYIFDNSKFVFGVSIYPIILSIVIGAITIYLSVIKSAKKSSKIAPIEAIRNNNEIKINSKDVKTPKIIDKLFGIGGIIAYKNLKRNKKRNRTTILSIIVSVAVFISLSSFINYGFKLTSKYFTDINYNMILALDDKDVSLYENISKLDYIDSFSIHRKILMEIDSSKYFSKDALNAFDGEKTYAEVISVGNEEFKRVLEENNIKEDSYNYKALLIDNYYYYVDGVNKSFNLLDLNKARTINGVINDKNVSIDIIKRISKTPMGLQNVYSDNPGLIVSDEFFDNIINNSSEVINGSLYINSSNPTLTEESIRRYLQDNNVTSYYLYNIDEQREGQKNTIILVSIFLYGFITVISLIGITNIINTINTNMSLRRREMASLKSIGMTSKEFNKMINLEVVLYSTKSLVYAIPLGIIGSFIVYKAFASGNDYGFIFPYQAILISIVAVFILVYIIMNVSLKKAKNENIIDIIKDENI